MGRTGIKQDVSEGRVAVLSETRDAGKRNTLELTIKETKWRREREREREREKGKGRIETLCKNGVNV